MKYRDKLKQKYEGLVALSGTELRKRRDKLNRAGVHRTKSSAEFSTAVRGTVKRRGSSRIPTGYPTVNSQFGR